MELSVIIVNYNVKYFLEQCLYSVLRACRNIEAELIIVDNNSTDGSRGFLEPKFPPVNFIWNDTNVGFAKANNQAIALARGKYILFLNSNCPVEYEYIRIFSEKACIRHGDEPGYYFIWYCRAYFPGRKRLSCY